MIRGLPVKDCPGEVGEIPLPRPERPGDQCRPLARVRDRRAMMRYFGNNSNPVLSSSLSASRGATKRSKTRPQTQVIRILYPIDVGGEVIQLKSPQRRWAWMNDSTSAKMPTRLSTPFGKGAFSDEGMAEPYGRRREIVKCIGLPTGRLSALGGRQNALVAAG